jgi:hypothetical protein
LDSDKTFPLLDFQHYFSAFSRPFSQEYENGKKEGREIKFLASERHLMQLRNSIMPLFLLSQLQTATLLPGAIRGMLNSNRGYMASV